MFSNPSLILHLFFLSQVEGVLDEEDFRLHVKREEFEEMCADIFERVRAPVDAALISAGMDISTIDQVSDIPLSPFLPYLFSLPFCPVMVARW